MNYQDKTREELIAELQELQLENRTLKLSCENNKPGNSSSLDVDKEDQIDFSNSKAHFELIFNTSPDAALITRLNDGLAVEVNDGYTKLTGYTRQETLGLSIIDIKLWKNPEDRQRLVDELLKNGFCENLEGIFLRKDGSTLIGLISAKTFMLHGVQHIFSIVRDISERKKVERNLVESEEKFRSLYTNMIDGSALHTLVYNEQGVPEEYLINDVNPAFETMLGISREAVVHKTSREAYRVEVPPYLEIYSRVALTGKPEVFETYFAPLEKYFSISVFCPARGRFATIFENITERKKAEKENERTQKLLEDSQRIGKIGGWEINIDTMDLKWTNEMYNIHEVDLPYVPKVDHRINFYTPESLTAVDEAVNRAIEHGESYEIDSEIITAKGNRKTIKAIGKADLGNRRVFGFFQDITERIRVEDELRTKDKLYRLLVENARDVIWTMKLDGSMTYISPAVEQMRGLTVEEAMHQPIDKILTSDSQVTVLGYIQKLNSAFESGLTLESFRGELEYYRKDGSTLWTEVIVFPLPERDNNSVTMLGLTRDISERKQFETKLLDQTNNLKELNASKDKFFSIIAHDLKSPLSGILGFSELLKNEVRNLDIESIEDYINIIYSSAEHTFELLDTLLEWARIQQGNIPFKPKTILLNSLITTEIEGLKSNADQKSISLENCTKENIITTVDEQMISSVIRNLISNAIKFTKKNGKVKIDAQMKGDQVEISVSDNGVGMTKESIEKLFRIETSFTTRGTENEKGTGLGLLLCKEFVEKHGGEIWLTSVLGQGSKFIISIPVQDR